MNNETPKQMMKAIYPSAYAAKDIDGFWNVWCPKGTNHDLTCTGSNESWQDGSSYA